MIWNTENQNGNKCYTSTVGPFIFTISESEGCFILSIEIIINDRPHDYRKDICESLGKAKGAAEWHLWELRDDAKSFLTTADAALRGGEAPLICRLRAESHPSEKEEPNDQHL